MVKHDRCYHAMLEILSKALSDEIDLTNSLAASTVLRSNSKRR